MEAWELIKNDIEKANILSKNNWKERYNFAKDCFDEHDLKRIVKHEKDSRILDIAKNNLEILKNYEIRKDFNNVVTVKLVIPSGCNAKCEFCYMKNYKCMSYNHEQFLNNFILSLKYIVKRIDGNFPISLDITGNEPTFNAGLIKEVMNKILISGIKSDFCRITLTTNGFKIREIIPYICGVVDYVNISVHHYEESERKKVFGIDKVLKEIDYIDIVKSLLDVGIDTSAVCVICKPMEDFNKFEEEFIKWCKNVGFVSLRIRKDCNWMTKDFWGYAKTSISKHNLINEECVNDSHWCRLYDNEGFLIYYLEGVEDTSIVSKGIEYVVNDDGESYVDFYKNEKLESYKFSTKYIFDKKY